MTDTKWTAGPWQLRNGTDIFGPLGGDSGDGVCADPNDGWQVAEVGYYASFVNGELVELDDDCRRANRHLIAAAPELYEAVESLLFNVAHLREAWTDPDQPNGVSAWEEWVIAESEARAAMAKARGES